MAKLKPIYRDWWAGVRQVSIRQYYGADYGFFQKFLEDYDKLCEASFGPGVKKGAYHLQCIGILKDLQNQGIGRKMSEFAEAKVCSSYSSLGIDR